jgi:AraC family transcriptional regulator
MNRSASPINRFLVHPQYSIFYRRAKKLQWPQQVQTDYGILFLLDGNLGFQTGAASGTLEPNEALLLEPSSSLSAHGENIETIFVTIAPAFLVNAAMRMRLVGPTANIGFPAQAIKTDRRLSDLARNLSTELATEDAGREIVLAALMEQIVVHLLRHFSNMRRSDELELSRVGLIDRRIRRAVELMHAQLDRELSLKEIAAASYLSPFHFARLFKKLTGASPHAYLATLRTRRAQLLLAETDLSVTEISARVGYASASHFTKAFRQSTGLTPRAFRKVLISR